MTPRTPTPLRRPPVQYQRLDLRILVLLVGQSKTLVWLVCAPWAPDKLKGIVQSEHLNRIPLIPTCGVKLSATRGSANEVHGNAATKRGCGQYPLIHALDQAVSI